MNTDQIYEVRLDIKRIESIMSTGIFQGNDLGHPLVQSALIEILICLRDLLYKCERFARRVAFDDDVSKVGKIKDVTHAIKDLRDAACHMDSDLRDVSTGTGTITSLFAVSRGNTFGIRIAGMVVGGKYDDDVSFAYGGNRVYLKRHILRAFDEAKVLLEPFLGRP
jgi:hypothetical protein